MPVFKAYSPNVEVAAESVLSVVQGMGAFKAKALKILTDCGISEPTPGKWYSQQAWLDAFKAISENLGGNTLYQIGLKIPESAKFPPEIDGIERALGALDVAYHMNHRGGEIGRLEFRSKGEKSAEMFCENPYPCRFDHGIIEAMAKRFKPSSSFSVSVTHEDSAACRSKGGESCTFRVQW